MVEQKRLARSATRKASTLHIVSYTKDNETSAPVVHFFCDRSDYSARLHVLDDNEGQMTGPTSWKAESGFVCLRCIKRHGEWYTREVRTEEYNRKRPARRSYRIHNDVMQNLLRQWCTNISAQIIHDQDLAKLPLPEIAEDTKELTAEQIALKTPPEFVIGRLTEFNYQSSKDGTTVTMEYFTQEQVDAQVWANSK